MNWEDVQNFCDDLSNWIVEIDNVEEFKAAYPTGTFPLKADPQEDDMKQGWETLTYITLWNCCKKQIKAPHYIESRIFLERFDDCPWPKLYLKLKDRDFKDPEDKWYEVWKLKEQS